MKRSLENTITDQAYAMFAALNPHEAYESDPEKFWEWFHSRYPMIIREEMEDTRDQ